MRCSLGLTQEASHLFGEHKYFPMMAAARIQQWAIILSTYDYHIFYRKAENHGNADGLSRVILPKITDVGTEAISAHINIFLTNHLQEAPCYGQLVSTVHKVQVHRNNDLQDFISLQKYK